MIRLENITKIYKGKEYETKALDNVNLEISKGQMVAVVGASGSGKSTLLNIIGAMDNATSGNYYYNDIQVSALRPNGLHNFRKRNVSFIFQNFALMNNYTIYENVELPLLSKGVSRRERKEIVRKQLQSMGIEELKNKFPTQVSGGQQQRCAIARALASGNELILADEPTGALDQKTGQDIMNIFKKLNEMGRTVIIITHDANVAAQCGRIIKITDGIVNGD